MLCLFFFFFIMRKSESTQAEAGQPSPGWTGSDFGLVGLHKTQSGSLSRKQFVRVPFFSRNCRPILKKVWYRSKLPAPREEFSGAGDVITALGNITHLWERVMVSHSTGNPSLSAGDAITHTWKCGIIIGVLLVVTRQIFRSIETRYQVAGFCPPPHPHPLARGSPH